MIRAATPADAEAIATIYNHYITDTIVTFEEVPLDAAEIARRIEEVQAAGLPWTVVEVSGAVHGYAYASPWKKRIGYRFSVESTVYLAPHATGQGLGSALYADLLERLSGRGLHLVIGGIGLPNHASVALHERMGFEKVAHFKEVGQKFGRWIDVGYWQRTIPSGQ
jgi:L-amino acid N-acyltransferase YncA